MSITKEKLKEVLSKLNIEIKDGKVSKTAVTAALKKFSHLVKADTAESGHLTDEHHNKVLDAIGEWRGYIEGYDQPENKMAMDMSLKALDCAAHCLSMAADSCKELVSADEDTKEVEENIIEEVEVEVEVEEDSDTVKEDELLEKMLTE